MVERRNRLRDLGVHERNALLDLLVAAVRAYGRHDRSHDHLDHLLRTAPVRLLPEAARLHRVTGAVSATLAGCASLPSDVRDVLEAERRVVMGRHLTACRSLHAIAQEFDAAGLRWLAMKGPVVASTLYEGAADRSYGDLDLLVARHDLGAAVSALERLGHTHRILNWPLAAWFMASEFDMAGPQIDVDVHWHFVYAGIDRERFAIEPDEILGRRIGVQVGGVRCPTMDPTDTLWHLAFHAARSGGHRLVWLKDVERALAAGDADRDVLVERSRAFGCGPAIAIVLRRARLVGADVSDEMIESLGGRTIPALDRFVARWSTPIRLHNRDTVARFLARSVHGSVTSTLTATIPRTWQAVRRRVVRPQAHETGDVAERCAYLDAVARS